MRIYCILAFMLLMLVGCNSTSPSSNPKLNETVVDAERSISKSDSWVLIEVLLKNFDSLTVLPDNFETIVFDSSYQLKTREGKITVFIEVTDAGILDSNVLVNCNKCSSKAFAYAQQVYDEVARLYISYKADFARFVMLYDKQKKSVEDATKTTNVIVKDDRRRISDDAMALLSGSIELFPFINLTKSEAFSLSGKHEIEDAIHIGLNYPERFEKYKVDYKNIAKSVKLSDLNNPLIAEIGDISVDLRPSIFEVSNDELSVSLVGHVAEIENLTDSFVEFEAISVYYKDKAYSRDLEGNSVPPKAITVELLSKLHVFDDGADERFIPILTPDQKEFFGLALKYKVGDRTSTLFERKLMPFP